MHKQHAVMDDAGSPPGEPYDQQSGQDLRSLAPALEAILLTTDKPVTAARLAEALGLTTPEEGKAMGTGQWALGKDPGSRTQDPALSTQHPTAADLIARAVALLNEAYRKTGRAFRIEQIAGGYRIMTLAEFAPVLAAFHRSRNSTRLSRAAVETLAIIAYRQPITRAHLEAIRGVGCGEVLRSLVERKLVTIKGRSEELGRPILYGTTREFLDAFGLASLKDLPTATELQLG